MSTFSPQFLDELRARVSLEDVVGRRVKLVRRGREYVGLSPFQKEKTPSFTVVPDKGFYHDFSSGEHGDVIDFVMKVEGLTFPEAVERLAAQAGMEIPVDSPEERERDRERQTLHEVMEAACAHFQKMLRMPEGRAGLDYLKGRGLTEATIERFRLGFAPDGRGSIKAALAREGISEDLMRAAGLIRRPDDGRPDYDYFRGRVMFPITDRRGRVVAFGGRIMAKGEPKYLNSPESAIFLKRQVLYGLAAAIPAAREIGSVIVAEGYMDVIALHQAGHANAVAPLGTAFTEDQLKVLWGFSRRVIVCFDSDLAGQKAMLRVVHRMLPILRPGYEIRFAGLVKGEDPDSQIKNYRGFFERMIADSKSLFEVVWESETRMRRSFSPEERAALASRFSELSRAINDPMVRRAFAEGFRDKLWRQMRKGSGGTPRATPNVTASRGEAFDPIRNAEQMLLAIVLKHPAVFETEGERLGALEFTDATLDRLRQAVVALLAERPDLDAEALERGLAAAGLAGEIAALLGDPLIRHHRRIGADADGESVSAAWQDSLATIQRAAYAAERRRIREGLVEEMTPDGWQRYQAALRAQIEEPES